MIGTLFFVVVFMLAIGSLAYVSGLQSQASQAQLAAQSVEGQKAAEDVGFSGGPAGLVAVNGGGEGVSFNHLLLAYPNGTVYSAPIDAYVAPRGSVDVGSLVPPGSCSPGGVTCESRYAEIIGGSQPGSSVGLLTSTGNTFWYSPGAPGDPSAQSHYLATYASTSSGAFVPVPGLGFAGSPGGSYYVSVQAGYYQSTGTGNEVYFAVSAPAGATFLACADSLLTTSMGKPSCTSVSGVAILQPSCTTTSPVTNCSFTLTVLVSFGPGGGTFQLEFRSGDSYPVYVAGGSYMLVTQVG